MAGGFLRQPRVSGVAEFHALRSTHSRLERWELIDGVPQCQEHASIVHQRVISNLQGLLERCLEASRPEWQAHYRAGVWLRGDDKYNPEPDVTVIDAAIVIGQIYVERFYFVAEVLSESDKKEVLEAKRAYYTQHAHNRCVLFVRQDRVGADQHTRQGKAKWRHKVLAEADAPLTFPDIGTIGKLGDLYKFTPLDPFA